MMAVPSKHDVAAQNQCPPDSGHQRRSARDRTLRVPGEAAMFVKVRFGAAAHQ